MTLATASPRSARDPRLAPLAKLPASVALAGRRAVVVGGGEPAAWTAELLAVSGASVDVYAPDPGPRLLALAAETPALRIHRRDLEAWDLDGAALVVAESGEGKGAERIRAAARARGVMIDVIDAPDLCDFPFGTVVHRSPAAIGIVTDGAPSVLGQALHRWIETIVEPALGAWAETAERLRGRWQVLLEPSDRRRFRDRFVKVTFVSQADEDERLAAVERLAREIASGRRDGPGRGTGFSPCAPGSRISDR